MVCSALVREPRTHSLYLPKTLHGPQGRLPAALDAPQRWLACTSRPSYPETRPCRKALWTSRQRSLWADRGVFAEDASSRPTRADE